MVKDLPMFYCDHYDIMLILYVNKEKKNKVVTNLKALGCCLEESNPGGLDLLLCSGFGADMTIWLFISTREVA